MDLNRTKKKKKDAPALQCVLAIRGKEATSWSTRPWASETASECTLETESQAKPSTTRFGFAGMVARAPPFLFSRLCSAPNRSSESQWPMGQAREGSSGAALPFAPSNGTEQQAVLSVHSLAQKALLLCHCFNSQAADLMKTATGAMATKKKTPLLLVPRKRRH